MCNICYIYLKINFIKRLFKKSQYTITIFIFQKNTVNHSLSPNMDLISKE